MAWIKFKKKQRQRPTTKTDELSTKSLKKLGNALRLSDE